MENLTKKIAVVGVMAAFSSVLMVLEFSLPIFPRFLEFNFSDLPALIIAFIYGPIPAAAIQLIKCSIHLFFTETAGIGELSNFLIGAVWVVSAGLIYMMRRDKTGILLGLAGGSLFMAVTGIFTNYFIILPFYENVVEMPMTAIINMCSLIIPFVSTKWDVVLISILPFNILKGIVISLITFIVYKKIGHVLEKYNLK
ncbi:MAG: ECF transporter S component [Oscillospiraceae bacterium]|nr:ECF transporter S component [Oscillospiraceae bacterium]